MVYLRAVRLRRAHDRLLSADPHTATVAAVALRCGITHLGRFSAAYRAAFGELPSATLHRQ
jgi:transcriptional regulator GlxA family with amidase domain